MDGDDLSLAESERALADLERVNRLFLAARPVIAALLPRLVAARHAGATLRLLDVGSGSGDVVARLAAAARRRGVELEVIGLDSKLRHLVAGRRLYPRQLRVVASADALPFADGAVEWTLSTLFFHHFGAATNRLIAAEMRRVASAGAAIIDLRRSSLLRLLIRPLLVFARAGRVAAIDGRLSAASAWSLEQVRALFPDPAPIVELRRRFPFRFSLLLRPLAAPLRDQTTDP